MTDMERFIELYKRFGIELKPERNIEYLGNQEYREVPGWVLNLEQGDHPNLGGYSGFGSSIEFTEDGKFIKQDFWE